MVHADGTPDFSIKFLNSFSALPKITPCPQTINGFFAEFINFAADSRALLFTSGTGL